MSPGRNSRFLRTHRSKIHLLHVISHAPLHNICIIVPKTYPALQCTGGYQTTIHKRLLAGSAWQCQQAGAFGHKHAKKGSSTPSSTSTATRNRSPAFAGIRPFPVGPRVCVVCDTGGNLLEGQRMQRECDFTRGDVEADFRSSGLVFIAASSFPETEEQQRRRLKPAHAVGSVSAA